MVALAVDPVSGLVAAGTLGGDVEIGRRISTLAWSPLDPRGPLGALGWRIDGRALAVGGSDGVVTVLDCSPEALSPG